MYHNFACLDDIFRMDCLEKVQKRQADLLAADPEDMYVAFNLKNEDFSVFSELRTVRLIFIFMSPNEDSLISRIEFRILGRVPV